MLKAEQRAKLNVYQRVNAIIAEGKAVPKTGQMQGAGGNYAFHRADDILAHLRPSLAEYGLDFSYTVLAHKCDLETVQGRNGPRTERRTTKKIRCVLTNVDKPEEQIVGIEYAYGIDSQDKGPGKAVSYCVKTWLLNKFILRGLPDEQNIDTYVQSITPDQQTRLRELISQTKLDEKRFLQLAFGRQAAQRTMEDLQFLPETKYATLERLLLQSAKKGNGKAGSK